MGLWLSMRGMPIGMVEGLPREISEVMTMIIHHTYGCIGFTRTA